MKQPIDTTFVIPAYNEQEVIAQTLDSLATYVRQHKAKLGVCEVVVVAAGNDKTAELAKGFAKKFDAMQIITPPSRVGKGRDVRLGLQAAQGAVRLFMDADLSTPLHHVLPMIEKLRGESDVVIGVRNLTAIHEGRARSLLSRASNLVIQTVLLPGYRDTQCGFKGFTAQAVERLFQQQRVQGWGFDLEVLRYAKEAHLRVAQLPIPDWYETRGDDLRGERLGSAALTTLKDLGRLRLQAWERTFAKHWKLAVLLAMAATFGLAFWLASQQSVWFDEAYSITLVQHSYSELVYLTSIDAHPPFYYLLLKVWSEIFGMGELALRSLSIVCATLAAGFGLLLTKHVFGLRALALTAPLVVLAPYVLRYAFEIRMYALASLIGIAATYVLVRAVQSKQKLWWVVYGLLVALGMYTLYFTAFIWAAHVIWLVYMYISQKPRTAFFKLPWLWSFLGAIVLYIPWLPTFIEQYRNPPLSGVAERVSWEQVTDIFGFMFIYMPHWALNPAGYTLVGLLALGMTYLVVQAIRRAGKLRPYIILLLLYLAIPIIIMALRSLPPYQPLFLMRYTSHFIIAGSLLLGASLFIVFRQKIRYAVVGTVLFAGVMVFGIWNLQHYGNFVFEMLTRPHAKQVSQAIGSCEPGSMVLTGSALIYFEFNYYLPDCDVRFYSSHPIGPRGGYATIYQSPKQYHPGQSIPAQIVYFVYTDEPPITLPDNLQRTSSQSFEKYHLDIYRTR